MDRREIIKRLSALPLAGAMIPLESIVDYQPQRANAASELNIFQKIGVEPVINCRGTFTIIGGSIERPEVLEAKRAASDYFVQMDELAFGIGQRLADLTGAEWGMVSCGCAAGMKHVTAACVTGGNPEKLVRIPDLTGFEKTEVVIPRGSRTVYDHAIRNIGVTIITVDTPEELEKSLNSRTAMIYIKSNIHHDEGPFSIEQIARIAKPHNIPILSDAAAEDLTVKPNIHLQRGATIVAYSGGKAICGPQNAGLLLGQKDILMSAWQASAPHHGTGRDNKVAKDTAMGMVAAVEAWIARDHAEKERTWLVWLENIGKRVSSINGVSYTITEPRGLNNRSARLAISWDPEVFNIYGTEVGEELATTKPRIALSGSYIDNNGRTGVSINSGQMQPGNDMIIADRLYEVLSRKHEKKAVGMAAPSANIAGRWNVDIEFYSSRSRHSFYIEQDGNFISGSHRGNFTTREMYGVVDGNNIRLASNESQIADNVPFTFHGTATNDKMEGGIYMGEYIRAKFTATRLETPANPALTRPIVVPQGQPLSS